MVKDISSLACLLELHVYGVEKSAGEQIKTVKTVVSLEIDEYNKFHGLLQKS